MFYAIKFRQKFIKNLNFLKQIKFKFARLNFCKQKKITKRTKRKFAKIFSALKILIKTQFKSKISTWTTSS